MDRLLSEEETKRIAEDVPYVANMYDSGESEEHMRIEVVKYVIDALNRYKQSSPECIHGNWHTVMEGAGFVCGKCTKWFIDKPSQNSEEK